MIITCDETSIYYDPRWCILDILIYCDGKLVDNFIYHLNLAADKALVWEKPHTGKKFEMLGRFKVFVKDAAGKRFEYNHYNLDDFFAAYPTVEQTFLNDPMVSII